MSLVTGNGLIPGRFFSSGNPIPRASSFDLTIGKIFDPDGHEDRGPFRLRPGHMVQVVSAQVFDLPDSITGHVTYKTSLTRKGIWALTVGIVDPGWNGPITTTLLNFSKIEHAIAPGDTFLRVTLFEHPSVPANLVTRSLPVDDYVREVRKAAITQFPPTFLNSEEIVRQAGDKVLGRVRGEALAWIAAITAVFVVIQLVATYLRPTPPSASIDEVRGLQMQVDELKKHLVEGKRAEPIRSNTTIPSRAEDENLHSEQSGVPKTLPSTPRQTIENGK